MLMAFIQVLCQAVWVYKDFVEARQVLEALFQIIVGKAQERSDHVSWLW